MKKFIYACALLGVALVACNQEQNEEYKEETIEMEAAEQEAAEAMEALEQEASDMEHDVDSLLEGI